MKRILASLFVTSVAICSAPTANAQLDATSVHSGTIPSACKVEATNATLVRIPLTIPTSISSDSGTGQFKMTCNTTHALKVEWLGSTHPDITTGTSYTEEFKLSGAISPYSAINTPVGETSGFVPTTTVVERSNLPATPTAGYTVGVAARGGVATGFLPAGEYIMRIKATITP
jgi:hypothetical protein